MAKNQINKVESNQLAVFDYSEYSEEIKLRSYERKARIKANEQVATKAFYDIAQDVKAQHDDLGNYQKWLDWCDKELGYKKDMACQLRIIGENLVDYSLPEPSPKSFKALLSLAKGLRDADDETKEEILTAVESKTEEKGKALTEKEIKEELAKIKGEYEEKIAKLERNNEWQGNVIHEFNRKGNVKEQEYTEKLRDIQIKQNNLQETEDKLKQKEDFLLLQEELNQKRFDREVDEKVKRELKIKQAELEAEKAKVAKELKEAKKLTKENQQLNKQLTDLTTWMDTLESFVFNITDNITQINRVINNLDQLPPVEALAPDEQKLFRPKLVVLSERFDEAQYKYGSAINSIHSKLKELNLNSFNQIIDVKAKGVK